MNSGAPNHNMRPMSLPMAGHVPSPVQVPNTMSQDLHTRQTIERLQCIQKHLKNPASFARTARELLEWCSDARAFQAQFHQCLMSCLTVVNDVAGKPGFDLDLCYKLVALCHGQRDKFTANAATMLGIWLQNIGKRRMEHHNYMDPMKQNNGMPQGVPGGIPNNTMMNQKMGFSQPHMGQRPPEQPMWNQAPQQPPLPNQHPSLSVITTATVWGVSTTQTPPVPVHSQSSSTSFPQQHMGHLGSHMGAGGENIQSNYNNNYANKPNPTEYQNSSMYPSGHRGMPQGRMGPQSHMNADQAHHQPAAAAAAAAVAAAAAAATATATATATIIKGQQDQNQIGSYDQMPQGSMGQNMEDSMMHQGMAAHQQHMPQVPNMHGMHPQGSRIRQQIPPQYGRAASVPASFPMTSPRPLTHDTSFKGNGRPQQPYGQVPFSGSPNMAGPGHFNKSSEAYNHVGLHRQASAGTPVGYGARMPGAAPSPIHQNGAHQQYYPYQNQQGPPDPYNHSPASHRPHFPPHYNEFQPRFPNAQTPIPGNPTPPLTPGSAHNVPPYPNMAAMGLNEGKPGGPEPFFPPYNSGAMAQTGSDDLRLTFPVRDGIVLGPFRLEHNLSLSSHAFHLRPNVYQTLVERPDLDLQFKCYHHDDMMKHTNWPHSVQVSVNGTQLTVPRGSNRSTHKPLYLKRVCHSGRNAIDITVSACCCSHFFVLQLVHRPSIRFVLKGLMVKRVLPDHHCRSKIQRNFSSGAISANNTVIPITSTSGAGEALGSAVKVFLQCPITYRRIQTPARGQDCKHIQCFDLESYLQLNSENATWKCPICQKNALLEVLEVDEFMHNILKTAKDRDYHLVSIDSNCNWKPLSGMSPSDGTPRPTQGNQMPNGMVKQEPFSNMNIKQEPVSSSGGGFSVKQEQQPYISALHIKQEPHHHRTDIDGPPNKRLKSVTSPGINLNNLPAPSPGSSVGCGKMGMDNHPGFPHSYDFSRIGGNPATSSGFHSGNNFLRGTSGVAIKAEISEHIAANDMVPIEKRLNPAMTGTNAGMLNGGSPQRRCASSGNPKTPQGSNTPLRPALGNTVLTPQSVGSNNNNCSTPSSMPNSNFNVVSSSSDLSGVNPTTPVVSLPNCGTLDQEDGLGVLDSLFGDNVGCGDGDPVSSLSLDPTSGMKQDNDVKDNLGSLDEILPDNDLMDILPDLGGPSSNHNNNAADEILSLFD